MATDPPGSWHAPSFDTEKPTPLDGDIECLPIDSQIRPKAPHQEEVTPVTKGKEPRISNNKILALPAEIIEQ